MKFTPFTEGLFEKCRVYLLPLLLICALLFYNEPLIVMKGLAMGGDGLMLFYPAEHLLARSLRAGTLPFWVPELQCGFPLLADGQPGPLYPINVLAFGLLPTPIAHNWVLLVHCLLGFLLTFWWGCTLGMRPSAAGWSGFLFTLTTPLVGGNVPLLEALAWSPGLFVLTERLVQGRTLRTALPISLVVALQWLAGFPQVAFYSLVVAFIYLVLRLRGEDLPRREQARLVLAWGMSGVLGLAMSAPQLLPTYELSRHSIRAGGIQGSMLWERSLFPLALVTYLLPSWHPFFSAAGLGFGEYIGLLPLLLALLPLVSRVRIRWLPSVIGMSVAALVLALGKFSPLFPLLQRLPGFSSFRVPSRFLFFTQLGLAILAGQGWELLFRSPQPSTVVRWVRRGLAIIFLLLLLNVVVLHPLLVVLRAPLLRTIEAAARRVAADPYHVQPWSYYEAKVTRLYGLLLEATSWRHPSVLLSFAILGIAGLCWRRYLSRPHTKLWVRWGWGGLIVVDLWTSAGWARPTLPPALVTRPPESASVLLRDAPADPYRVLWVVDQDAVNPDPGDLGLLPANYHALFDLSGTGIYSPLGFYDYYRLLEDLGTVNLAFGLRPVTVGSIQSHRSLLDLLNVRYVLSRTPMDAFPLIARAGDVYIYRNERALPRAFAVDRAYTALSHDSIIRWLGNDADRARTYALLEERLPFRLTPGAASASTVAIESYAPTLVKVRVSAAGNILVILTDTFYPGWEAYLDGNPIAIYRADGVFRAVAVPPGLHLLTFKYRPRMFQWGLLIAALGAAVTLILCVRKG